MSLLFQLLCLFKPFVCDKKLLAVADIGEISVLHKLLDRTDPVLRESRVLVLDELDFVCNDLHALKGVIFADNSLRVV